jgi:hypothetical protein
MKIKALSNYQITRMYNGRTWKQMSSNKNENKVESLMRLPFVTSSLSSLKMQNLSWLSSFF